MPTLSGSFTCRKFANGTDGFTSLPKEGVLRILFVLKNRTASAGVEPANLGTKGQHATSRPPKPLRWALWHIPVRARCLMTHGTNNFRKYILASTLLLKCDEGIALTACSNTGNRVRLETAYSSPVECMCYCCAVPFSPSAYAPHRLSIRSAPTCTVFVCVCVCCEVQHRQPSFHRTALPIWTL